MNRVFFCSFMLSVTTVFSQSTNISTNFNQAAAATDLCNTTNVKVYGFQANVFGFSSPSFTAINSFVSSGTYLSSDIQNFKLYSTSSTTFNTSSLVATITTGLGAGTHSFTGFTFGLPFSGGGTQTYFWITVDIAPAAGNGRTIRCDAIVSPMLAITGTLTYGTNVNGGLQTISCITTPVELISFTGNDTENGNLLQWSTSSESGSDHFTVERSRDGLNYLELANIEAAGNSTGVLNYQFLDDQPGMEMNYYRLQETDINSDHTFSNVIAVYDKENSRLSLFPNPVSDKLQVRLPPINGIATAQWMDTYGQIIRTDEIDASGSRMIIFDMSFMTPGFYYLVVQSGEKRWQQKFVKQ